MNKALLIFLLFLIASCSIPKQTKQLDMDLTIPFEKNSNQTATYAEAIKFFENLALSNPLIQANEFGMTDAGLPLHEVILTNDGIFDPAKIKESGKAILFINNGIHPGEPCGVDASMMLARDIYKDYPEVLKKVTVIIVPLYNIGGALNRNSTTRANQDGPESYGFRGNAKNLDLNRDFIKCDSKNALSFNKLFTKWSPDLFIDTHTSNGADYSYTMTLIPTQKDKLETPLNDFLVEEILPLQYERMAGAQWEMIPYVYAREKPDDGIAGFLDLPRYSTGYAALHHTIGFMPETHMLKPFPDRVWSTYHFLKISLEIVGEKKEELIQARREAFAQALKKEYPIQWEMNRSMVDQVNFKGYEAGYKPSAVTGEDRLYYDRSKPFEKTIDHYNTYRVKKTIVRPEAYLIPQAYTEVIDRLKNNGVVMTKLENEQEIDIEMYLITDYESPRQPYEGHFLHTSVECQSISKTWIYRKGDYVIPTNQASIRYIIETLEPESPDSFFAWNFFDGILMAKEHYSAYVFEDLAAEYLKNDSSLRKKFENEKASNEEFAQDPKAQLDFIYKHSPNREKTYSLYPIGRFMNGSLPK